ncbi:Atp-dependent dna helicase, partial [Thalictrum thalictroides]
MEENIIEELLNIEVELEEVQDQIKSLLDRQEKLYERQSELQSILEQSKQLQQEQDEQGTVGAASSVDNNINLDWSGKFEWDSRADDIRLNVFGISNYRANQRQ